jgi:hypothetical protein
MPVSINIGSRKCWTRMTLLIPKCFASSFSHCQALRQLLEVRKLQTFLESELQIAGKKGLPSFNTSVHDSLE